MKSYIVLLSTMASSTVTDSMMIQPLLQEKTKGKEERAEGICAGMHSHFDTDNEVTLEMHWDIGHDDFSVSLG